MAQQEPDLKNQNPSPATNAGAVAGASAPVSPTPAPAPQSAQAAPAPAMSAPSIKDAKAQPNPNQKPALDPKKGPAGKDPKASKRAYREIPNETFVRRRKQKRAALVVLSVAGIGCFILGMVAFLGNYSGEFTVKIDSRADLTMDSTDGTFTTKTSYLKATGLENASTIYADNLPDDDIIDSATGGSKNGLKQSVAHPDYKVDTYMAYTFYVKNVSKDSTYFNLQLNLDAYKNGINQSCSLVDIVRLRLYANRFVEGQATTHENTTYAKMSADGVSDEIVSYATAAQDRNKSAATSFLSDKVVMEHDYTLGSQEMMRYTVIMWLEGFDPQCTGTVPEGAFASFSMFFSVL